MTKYFPDEDGVIRNLPDPTPRNREAKQRKLRDEARFTADRPVSRKDRERLHEAMHEHNRRGK